VSLGSEVLLVNPFSGVPVADLTVAEEKFFWFFLLMRVFNVFVMISTPRRFRVVLLLVSRIL